MKLKKIPLFFLIYLTTINNSLSQTDTPCGAPALTVNTTCSSTTGTTVGAAYQNDAANGELQPVLLQGLRTFGIHL